MRELTGNPRTPCADASSVIPLDCPCRSKATKDFAYGPKLFPARRFEPKFVYVDQHEPETLQRKNADVSMTSLPLAA